MFSDKDLQTFELSITLPKKEDAKNPVEELLLNCPLSTFKASDLNELVVELKHYVDKLPTMVLSGKNSQLSLSSKSLSLNISPRAKNEDKEEEQLTQEQLRLISNDFNFLLAKLLGILNVQKLNAILDITFVQKKENSYNYDKYLSSKFWEDFKEYEDIHIFGVILRTKLVMSGVKSPLQLSFSNKTDSFYANIKSDSEISGPIDILSMMQERLALVNSFNKKLVE